MKSFSITNNSRNKVPSIPYEKIKDQTLGKNYALSLVFISPEKIKKLNLIYRNKNTPTDILSFPISNNIGEIYISLSVARKKAKDFNRNYKNFIAFLFIHGCVHLKGYDHGSTMENIEVKIREKFGI